MIKVEKQVSITIDGEDIQSLSDVCEMAKRYICANKKNELGEISVSEFDCAAFCRITNFIEHIFAGI